MGRYAATWFQSHLAAVNAPKELRVWVSRRRFDDAWRQCPYEAWRPVLLQAMGLWNIPAVVAARDAFDAKLNAAVSPTVQAGEENATVGQQMFDAAVESRRQRIAAAREAYEAEIRLAEADFSLRLSLIAPTVAAVTENDITLTEVRREAEAKFYADLVAALPPIHNPRWVLGVDKTDPKGYSFFEEGGRWMHVNDRP